MIKVGIIGGTGYTGVELLRILSLHPEVEVRIITSRADAGRKVSEVYPHLRYFSQLTFTQPSVNALLSCDLVFFATPHGVAMTMAPALLEAGVRVIDLSADFRLQDPDVWAQWYGMPHACPELIPQSVYGLPELNRERLKDASLIACAGCYPTAVQLGLLPLVERGWIDLTTMIADVKSGVSGGGRTAALGLLMSEAGESLKAYAVKGHRHLPEITQGLASMRPDDQQTPIGLTFTPHLAPMIRGIHATLYAQTQVELIDIHTLYAQRYQAEPFVTLLAPETEPNTRYVRGSNHCQIGLFKPQGANMLVILAVIDNLVKGAAGQAVQIMNINYGFDERLGLETVALYP